MSDKISLFERLRAWIGNIGWRLCLWGRHRTEKSYWEEMDWLYKMEQELKMNEQTETIVWHKGGLDLLVDENEYLITTQHGVHAMKYLVSISTASNIIHRFFWNNGEYTFKVNEIIAWATMPKGWVEK